jgi:hypothetical protein
LKIFTLPKSPSISFPVVVNARSGTKEVLDEVWFTLILNVPESPFLNTKVEVIS